MDARAEGGDTGCRVSHRGPAEASLHSALPSTRVCCVCVYNTASTAARSTLNDRNLRSESARLLTRVGYT